MPGTGVVAGTFMYSPETPETPETIKRGAAFRVSALSRVANLPETSSRRRIRVRVGLILGAVCPVFLQALPVELDGHQLI